MWKAYVRLISKVNEAMMWFCGILIIVMGVATACDIVMRTLFNSPIKWAFDLNCYLCAAVAFLAGGYGLLVDRHVKVDILYLHFPARTKGIVDACTSIFLFILCIVLVWMGSISTINSFRAGSGTGDVLNIPLYFIQALVPLGGLLLGLQAIVNFVRNVKLAVTGRAEGE